MSDHQKSSLHMKPQHFRTADLVIGVAFLLAGIIGGYFAIADGVRDYWLLLVVGILGAVLMFRRARRPDSAA